MKTLSQLSKPSQLTFLINQATTDDLNAWQEALKDYMISKGYIGSQDKAG